jgi:hypothetical protein
MPVVFVHGVSNRAGADYDQAVKEREGLFRRILLADAQTGQPYAGSIRFPYWGQFGARFRWNHASLPSAGGFVALGGAPDARMAALLAEMPRSEGGTEETVLSDIARISLPGAVDLLWGAASDSIGDAQREKFDEFARRAANYAEHNLQPAWARPGMSNDDFVDELVKQVEAWQAPAQVPAGAAGPAGPVFQALGFNDLLNGLLDGASRIKDAAGDWVTRRKDQLGNWVSQKAIDAVRGNLHPMVATFIGDVVVYFHERGDAGNPGAIVKEVSQSLQAAAAERTAADPLIAVGHSLGGVILYDLLTTWLTNLRVDLLVTVGSQVALFEEMKQYRLRNEAIPGAGGAKMPRPGNVKRWVNVYDPTDIFSFAVEGVFDRVEDYKFSSETDLFAAHSAYFQRPSFFQRLRARL